MRVMCLRPAVLAVAQVPQQSAPPPPPPPRPAFDIRPSLLREELERAAWLRAEAYYEERSVGRFKQSFVKQFAGQELYSLLRRTQGAQPECIALVATLPGAPAPTSSSGGGSNSGGSGSLMGPGSCIGTLDVRVLDPANPYPSCAWPDAVPAEPGAAYVSNVVVAPARRGRGLGRLLLAAGLEAARERWGVARVYCHVETDNEAALALYRGADFVQQGPELPRAEEGLANRLLLCWALGGS